MNPLLQRISVVQFIRENKDKIEALQILLERPSDWSNDPKLFSGPYPFIQTGDVTNSGGRITFHKDTYNGAGLAQGRLFPAGTVCITIAANIAETGILTYPACFPDPEEEQEKALYADEFPLEPAKQLLEHIQKERTNREQNVKSRKTKRKEGQPQQLDLLERLQK